MYGSIFIDGEILVYGSIFIDSSYKDVVLWDVMLMSIAHTLLRRS